MNDEDVIERAARAAHEANLHYCFAIGDESQVSWDDAPEWQRESVRNGVKLILSNPLASPQASHQNWLEEKKREGWKYGPVKDVEKREHPCFVPYEELPPWQCVKDLIFGSIVRGVLAHSGAEAMKRIEQLAGEE